MKILKNFFLTIRNSVYGPDFYAKMPQKTFGFALLYHFFLRLAVFSLVAVFLVGAALVGKSALNHTEWKEDVLSGFPSELTLTVKDGKFSHTGEDPQFIEWGEDLKVDEQKMDHFAVVDTGTPFSLEAYQQYHALVWLAADGIYYPNQDTVRALSYKTFPDLTFDSARLAMILDTLEGLLIPLVLMCAIFGALFLTVFLTIWQLLYNVIFALLVWMMARMFGLKWKYSDSYVAGLYLVTLSVLLQVLPFFFGQIPPFAFTLLALLVAALNFSSMRSSKKGKRS